MLKNEAEAIYIKENKPFPNNPLPVLYYPAAIAEMAETVDASKKVTSFFRENGYSNSWVNGIFPFHHFHSNTPEVLGCISGEAHVQLGGPHADIFAFKKGDVLLLPAGIAHKRMDATNDFCIIGAYPNGLEPDMQKGEEEDYFEIKAAISRAFFPQSDPVGGKEGALFKYWKPQTSENK